MRKWIMGLVGVSAAVAVLAMPDDASAGCRRFARCRGGWNAGWSNCGGNAGWSNAGCNTGCGNTGITYNYTSAPTSGCSSGCQAGSISYQNAPAPTTIGTNGQPVPYTTGYQPQSGSVNPDGSINNGNASQPQSNQPNAPQPVNNDTYAPAGNPNLSNQNRSTAPEAPQPNDAVKSENEKRDERGKATPAAADPTRN